MELKTIQTFKMLGFSFLGAVVIYLSAQISFELPGSNIPQTGQTLGILVVAAILGGYGGFIAILIYLTAGLAGLPVFANGAMGIEVFLGPTKGYLLGFVFASLFCSWWFSNTKSNGFLMATVGMILSHGLILVMGWLWLASLIGPDVGFEKGVAPFFIGAVVKSLLSSAIVVGYFSLNPRSQDLKRLTTLDKTPG